MQSLLTELRSSRLASQPEADDAVWLVKDTTTPDAERLLARCLAALLTSGADCFLQCDVAIGREDLPGPGWAAMEPGMWRVPPELDPHAFLRSGVHREGSYIFYASESSAPPQPSPDVPWWGAGRWEGRARLINALLRAAGAQAAIAVHADASDWVAAVPAAAASGTPVSRPPTLGEHVRKPRNTISIVLGSLMIAMGAYIVISLLVTSAPLSRSFWLDAGFAAFFLLRGALHLNQLRTPRAGP